MLAMFAMFFPFGDPLGGPFSIFDRAVSERGVQTRENENKRLEALPCAVNAWRMPSGQHKNADAELLLQSAYEGISQSAIKGPAEYHVTEAFERLIDFYRATNRPGQEAKWRGIRR